MILPILIIAVVGILAGGIVNVLADDLLNGERLDNHIIQMVHRDLFRHGLVSRLLR